MLSIITPSQLSPARAEPVSAATLAAVAPIVEDVRTQGEPAVRRHAEFFREIAPGDAILIDKDEIAARARSVSREDLDLLQRAADRITAFALAQRASISDFQTAIPGGLAGHTLVPIQAAGCYAPGGRYPLPSSVLMTACVARAAGVPRVLLASPKPAPITYAAALVANVDHMLTVGGPHAIAAMAYGLTPPPGGRGQGGGLSDSMGGLRSYVPSPNPLPLGRGLKPVDLIVGPGNKFVTAAKKLVLGTVGIDMLAGPSELVVLHDHAHANPATVAADLLAQAEHDDDARPILVTTSSTLATHVAAAFESLCLDLPEPNRATARRAARNGLIILCSSLDQAIDVTNSLAPEHLEILTADPRATAERCLHAGALFLGESAAEVFGDYGIGPNHTLPTGGSPRFAAGLSVLTFLRARTWLERAAPLTPSTDPCIIADTARLARLEGLEAHARAAERRLPARS